MGITPAIVTVLAVLGSMPGIEIVSPVDGHIARPGDTVLVRVEVQPGVEISPGILLYSAAFTEVLEAPPYQGSVEIPVDQGPGRFPITALATAGVKVFEADVALNILIPSKLVGIEVEPEGITLGSSYSPSDPQSQTELKVLGVFADGVKRDLGRAPETLVRSKDDQVALVTVKEDSLRRFVRGVAEGKTVIEIRNGDHAASVGVEVRSDNSRPVARILPKSEQGPKNQRAPVLTGTPITLDGSSSFDPNDDEISFEWKLDRKPPESALTIESSSAQVIHMVPDRPGSYALELAVRDDEGLTDTELAAFVASAPFSSENSRLAAVRDPDLGYVVTATVVDEKGEPVVGTPVVLYRDVESEFGVVATLPMSCSAVMTDSEGSAKFDVSLAGVPRPVTLSARLGGCHGIEMGPRITLGHSENKIMPLRLRLVDRKGAPIPDYRVAILDGEGSSELETLTTDEAGHIVSANRYDEGRIRLRLIDHPDLYETHPLIVTHDHLADGDRIYELKADRGPTFDLDLQLPMQVSTGDLVAELFRPGHPTAAADRPFVRAPVRSGSHPWVRFLPRAPQYLRIPRNTGWLLRIYTADERLAGTASVDWVWGIYPEPVKVRLHEVGSVRGFVRSSDGSAVEGARVRLVCEENPPRWRTVDAGGNFEFGWLEVGPCSLTAFSGRHLVTDRVVHLSAASRAEVDFLLQEPEEPVRLRGRFTSKTGTAPEERERPCLPAVFFRSTSDGSRRFSATVQPVQEADGDLGTFTRDDVAPDEYRVHIRNENCGYHRWELSENPVVLPTAEVVLTRRDDLQTSDLGFRVFEAGTGDEIRTASISIESYTGDAVGFGIDTHQVILRNYPVDASLQWSVRQRGYTPVFGDRSSFSKPLDTDDGPLRIARVTLKPGWGARFRVRGISGDPLEGVTVSLDGIEVGRTDSGGEVVARLPSRPQTASFAKPGWQTISQPLPRETDVEIKMHPD